jgi:hypothetical protein
LLHRYSERIVQGVLSQVEIAKQADQGSKYAARVGAVDGVYLFAYLFGGVFVRLNYSSLVTRNSSLAQSGCMTAGGRIAGGVVYAAGRVGV